MIGLARHVWGLFVLACVAYVFFFVRLGERTLFEHTWRIAQTDEAQDLGREVRQTSVRLSGDLREQVQKVASERTDGSSR